MFKKIKKSIFFQLFLHENMKKVEKSDALIIPIIYRQVEDIMINFINIIDNELVQNNIIEYCGIDILNLLRSNRYVHNCLNLSQQMQNMKKIKIYKQKLVMHSISLDNAIKKLSFNHKNISVNKNKIKIGLIMSENIFKLNDPNETMQNIDIYNFISDLPYYQDAIDNDQFLSHYSITMALYHDSINILLSSVYHGDFSSEIYEGSCIRIFRQAYHFINIDTFTNMIPHISRSNIKSYDHVLKNLIYFPRISILLFMLSVHCCSYNLVIFLHDIIKQYDLDPNNHINNLKIRMHKLQSSHWFAKILLTDRINDELGILRFKILKLGYLLLFLNKNYKKILDKMLFELKISEQILCVLLLNDREMITEICDKYITNEYNDRNILVKDGKWMHNLEYHLTFRKSLSIRVLKSINLHNDNLFKIFTFGLTIEIIHQLLKLYYRDDVETIYHKILRFFTYYFASPYTGNFFEYLKHSIQSYNRSTIKDGYEISMEHISNTMKHINNQKERERNYCTLSKIINLFVVGIIGMVNFYLIYTRHY